MKDGVNMRNRLQNLNPYLGSLTFLGLMLTLAFLLMATLP